MFIGRSDTMASSAIHLAIAKKYLEKHSELNYVQVIAGTLYPDATKDKDLSHYNSKDLGHDNVSHVRSKVNLYHFLEEHHHLNDFEVGWFYHLVTDYLFFEECFTEEYLLGHSCQEFCKDLYFAYDCLNQYLPEKYHITQEDYKDYPSEYYPGKPYENCILPKELIDSFIERVANIEMNSYIRKIQKYQRNVKP